MLVVRGNCPHELPTALAADASQHVRHWVLGPALTAHLLERLERFERARVDYAEKASVYVWSGVRKQSSYADVFRRYEDALSVSW